jgi:beta-lactamase regulating signal transducer with metallopeptidase domain
MTVGGSIFLIAVGAILRYAVTDAISGVNLATVGLILIVAGIVGLLIGLFMMANARRSGYVVRERQVERDPYVEREPLV